MYNDKVKEFIELLEEKHLDLYFNISKFELNNFVKELLLNYSINNDYDFYYILNVIIKKIFGRYDSHTRILCKQSNFILPIRFKLIDGKAYVVKSDEKNKDLLFGELISINNISLSELIKEIELMTPYSTNEFLQSEIEKTLHNGFKIKSLPSIKDVYSDEFNFKILSDDKIIDRKLTKSNINFYEDTNYTYKILDNVLHIIYSSCREEYEGQMNAFVKKIKILSNTCNIKKYIIDLRGNTGGNNTIIKPLIEFLKDKETITLVDKYIFSSGRFSIVDLKRIGTKFVGTQIGTTLNCFGNISRNEFYDFVLPISYKYFYYDEENISMIVIDSKEKFLEFKNNPNNQKYFIPQFFEPDYYIVESIDDYKNNNDLYVKKALEIFNKEKIK